MIPATGEAVVEFIKRSTGELRTIRCTRTPPEELISQTPTTRPRVDLSANGLINVFDLDEGKFKSIPIDGIKRIQVNGHWIQYSRDAAPVAQERSSQ